MERTITVISDIKTLGELLHGASIDRTRLALAGGALRLDVEITRPCPELKTQVRRGFMTKTKVPWVKSRLSINQVQDASIERLMDGAADQQPLLVCEAVPGGYTLVVTSPEGMKCSLTLSTLDGQCIDVGHPVYAP